MDIYFDYREKGLIDLIKLKKKESKNGVKTYDKIYDCVFQDNLDVGDIEICDNDDNTIALIERKTYSDLYASIKDGRYYEQKSRLMMFKNKGIDIYYLIEKNEVSEKHMKIIRGAMVSIPVKHDIKLLHSEGIEDTLKIIMSLPKKLGDKMGDKLGDKLNMNTNITRKANINREHFYYSFLLNLPSIGNIKANKIIDKYDTLTKFISAVKDDSILEHKLINKNIDEIKLLIS